MAENTGLYLTAMVGIVAVVAVVILMLNAGSTVLISDSVAGDLSGQAVKPLVSKASPKTPLAEVLARNQFNQIVADKLFLPTVKQRGLLDDLVRNGLIEDLVTNGFVVDVGGMFDPGFSFEFGNDFGDDPCAHQPNCDYCEDDLCAPGGPDQDPEECESRSDDTRECVKQGHSCICHRRSNMGGVDFNNQFTPDFLDQLENMQNNAHTFEQYLAIKELLDYGYGLP